MTPEDLIAAYAAPNRHYHNLAHIRDCLDQLARVDGLSAAEREVLETAIWWHDVVYDPRRSDNEELSAQLAEQHLDAKIAREVGRLIRLTRTHQVEPSDKLGAILISIDLSILGAEPSRYDAYAAAIRKEFAHVPDAAYRAGRSDVLRRFAARPVIFPDAAFARALDKTARDNLARELAALEGDRSLRSLAEVGPAKPVGYLPLDTIRNFTTLSVEAVANEARARGLAAAQFDSDACCIKSGALYVYDREALAKVLKAQAGAVAIAGLPNEPDRFVAQIASVWYPEDDPAYRVIAAAFGEAV
ncbi:hypothetical protein [Bradyrhizobium sp.]|uniref:HD domain-containing protein n=1 Tax=Bradyrhizobium sp. TaxID=376 RepID=UPI002D43617F|nr:hypothetical protein [Bradyrhizobium sp.]HZR73731.1 hypothetical protein [Bradyrhizobium sp.]